MLTIWPNHVTVLGRARAARGLRRNALRTTAALAALGAVTFATTALASSAASGWSVQPTPRPGHGLSLLAVSCTSPSACTAVGEKGNKVTLAERWNGSRWSIQRTPSPAGQGAGAHLNDVSCVSARFCVAVGVINGSGVRPTSPIGHTLAEQWNGKRWWRTRTPTPAGGAGLAGVSCNSPRACMAVQGRYAYRWNGRRWSLLRLASPDGFIAGVSCTSSRDCTAVGYTVDNHSQEARVSAMRWNGRRWSIQSTPTPAGGGSLTGVSCTSSRACTAVGQGGTDMDTYTLVERWNGRRWSIQPTPQLRSGRGGEYGNGLTGVSCPSSNFCTAVGNTTKGAPLAEHWNGRRWRIQATPRVPHGRYLASLNGVSCATTETCIAVGFDTAANTLAERWKRNQSNNASSPG